MLTYNCSVCQCCCDNSSTWLQHLLQEEHQKLARMELLQWSKKMRSRSLVIFAMLPVGEDVGIIAKLSRDAGGGSSVSVVTDLVWWEGQPQVGFVQFESRIAVTNVLASIKEQDQLWSAMDGDAINYFDWMVLISDCASPPPGAGSGSNKVPEGREDSPDSREANEEMVGFVENVGVDEVYESSPIFESGRFGFQDGLGLRQHLSSIQKLIEIPDHEYDTALDIAHCLQEALTKDRQDGDPVLKAVFARHWFLKLKYSGAEELLDNIGCALVVCRDSTANTKTIKLDVIGDQTRRILNCGGAGISKHLFCQYLVVEVSEDPSLGMGRAGGKRRIQRFRFVHQDTPNDPFLMSIVYRPGFPLESQVWNLVRHLCSFDPRCYPVLSVLYYWARINSVFVGKSYMNGGVKELADPCGLNWLLIFYFQMEGLIPSTREVLARPHQRILNMSRDIGFEEGDTSWWTGDQNVGWNSSDGNDAENFAADVFTLLYKFFLFCDAELWDGSREEYGWIMNTRDTEIISVGDLLEGVAVNSNMNPDELRRIRRCLMEERGELDRIVMLQPFYIDWERKISCSHVDGAFRSMKVTGLKLKNYLENNDNRDKLEFDEFLNLLKL